MAVFGNHKVEKVLILLPVQSVMEPEAVASYGCLVAECCRREAEGRYKFSAVVVPRNMAAERAIENHFDWLWMIDDDMIIPSDAFFKLVQHSKDVISPLIFMRRVPCDPSAFKEHPLPGQPNVLNYRSWKGIVDMKPGLHMVDAAGAACMLIRVRALGSIIKPYFWTGDLYGEDIFFCHKMRHEGKKKVYMDTSIEALHLSERVQVGRKVYEKLREGRRAS